MFMVVGLATSKVCVGQRSEVSEIDYNSLKFNLGLHILLNLNV